MENAAKALSIAASVLIGVLLLALLIYAYWQFVKIPQQQEKNAKFEQTAEFNKRYEAYNKQNLKGNKLLSLLNMATDNNETFKNVPEYKITINVKTGATNISYTSTKEYNSRIDEIKEKTWKCTKVEYGSNGRISSMSFVNVQ